MTWLTCLLYALAYLAAVQLGYLALRRFLGAWMDDYETLRRLEIARRRRQHPPPWRRVRL
jgi:hypothetical protein